MDHVVEIGDLVVGVGNQRVVELRALRLLDVLRPAVVRVERVDAHADHLDVALVELGLALGERAQLGGAHRCEVLRVGEEHPPAVAQVVVEVHRALGGLRGEVRRVVAQSHCHVGASFSCRISDYPPTSLKCE
jgi:hypothetical protein